VGERLHLGRLWTLERELHLGLLGMLLDCEEQQQLPGVFAKAKNSCSSSVQQVQLPFARSKSVQVTNAAAPPPHGEMDEEDLVATCQCAPAISLYTSTAFGVHRSSFQTAPNRNKGGTQRSRKM
jgi:hypothetical protein